MGKVGSLFGFDQEIGGVSNQSPSLEVPRNDPLTGGLQLKPMTLVIIAVVAFVVYKFVLKK